MSCASKGALQLNTVRCCFAYTVEGPFVHTASMGKSGGMPQANMRVVVGECGLSTPSACHPHLSTSQRDSAHRKTLRNAARRSAQKRKTRRSGPSCKNLRSRIAAQQHRRNGKSIQCPFNVTTYLGHTHLVGLCSSVVLVLRNYARHCGKCKPKRDDVPYLSQLLLSDCKNRKMLHAVRIATLACSFTFICPEKTACRKHISPTQRTNVNSCLIFLSFARHSKHLRIK